jgi:hypothetical protein
LSTGRVGTDRSHGFGESDLTRSGFFKTINREVRRREVRGMNLPAVFWGPLVIDSRYVLFEKTKGIEGLI